MATVVDGAHSGDDGGRAGPVSDDERAGLASLRSRFPPRHMLRSEMSAALIVLAAVLAPLCAVAVWVADQMGGTGRYVRMVGPPASRPDVRAAATDRVTDAVMGKVDLNTLRSSAAVTDRPKVSAALSPLRGRITGGIKDFVHRTAASFVASRTFATLWTQLSRQAHAAFTGTPTGGSGSALRINGDKVVLDLAPVVAQVKKRLVDRGLGVAAHIPAVRAQYTLVKSKGVRRARTGFRALQLLGKWLPAVTVVLAVVKVLLAVRRQRALVTAALAVAVGVAALGVTLALLRIVYLNNLPAGIDERVAGTDYDQLVGSMRVTVRMIVVLGVVVALSAWLSGPGRWAARARTVWESGIAVARGGAGLASTGAAGPWVHRHRYVLRWGVVLVGAVVALLWSCPTGLVIFWIAPATIGALGVVEFLDDTRHPHDARLPTP